MTHIYAGPAYTRGLAQMLSKNFIYLNGRVDSISCLTSSMTADKFHLYIGICNFLWYFFNIRSLYCALIYTYLYMKLLHLRAL